ncbi:CHAT domain-containing protein [Micromonospora sp. WMMD558]|uniref:CHAT domain-containing protein n=1 Tax=unclassified Micromonospora TaxID=2617518 RepID=UPI0018AFC144|nr:CHAT domain-containing protein [Micromonospora sp. WMMC415]
MPLTLRAVEVTGPARWRWLLTDDTGRTLADHQVDVDPHGTEFEAFTDLDGYLRRNRLPDDRLGSEAAIVTRVGRWIGSEVLGEHIGRRLAGTVRVLVPPEGDFLLTRPLELAEVDGRALARRDVALVFELPGSDTSAAPVRKQPVGDRLRILALFSMPARSSVLALRRERYELVRTVREIASRSRKAIELRVLQYGVTRDRLAETAEEYPGWDVLHVSGHGARGTLLLENPDGSPDEVGTDDLIKLLRPARDRLKFAVLSACNSGADLAASTLRNLRLDDAADQLEESGDGPTDGGVAIGRASVGLARGLVTELGVAVLAMRYPVADPFAVELTRELYPRLLGSGQPVDRAAAIAIPRAAGQTPSVDRPPLSVGTPALFGGTAAGMHLAPPPGSVDLNPYAERMVGFREEPERFVGRTPALISASGALAPRSGRTGVLFHGMAGAGKTSCALELAYQHQDRFAALAWWEAPSQPDEFGQALSSLAHAWEGQLGHHGLTMMQAVGSEAELRRFLPRLRAVLRDNALLLVLDNIETLLSDARTWRDPLWEPLIETLLGHGGLSRVVLTSRVVPAGLDARSLLTLPVHALSLAESVLLAKELPNLGRLLHDEPSAVRSAADVAADRELARRVLAVVQGHPKLLELADAEATDPDALAARLDAASAAGRDAPTAAFFRTGTSALDGEEYLNLLGAWTTAAVAGLPAPARTLVELLALLEDDDRWYHVIEPVWQAFWDQWHGGTAPPFDDALSALTDAALVAAEVTESKEPDGPVEFRLHPGVAEAIRAGAGPELRTTVDNLLAEVWASVSLEAQRLESRGEPTSRLVVRAGLAAAPYLLHQQRWSQASVLVEEAAMRDASPATTRQALGYLRQILDGETDPERRPIDEALHARVLARIDPAAGQAGLRRAIDAARGSGRHDLASGIGSHLANLLRTTGELSAALATATESADSARIAGLGPWTRASGEVQRLQILVQMGRDREVLEQVDALLARLDTLPHDVDHTEQVYPYNVRETALDVAAQAARGLSEWTQALDYQQRLLASKRERGAHAYELARMEFNDYRPLLQRGELAEAERVLLRCQTVFEAVGDVHLLGHVFGARADLEDERDRPAEAVTLGRAAMRYTYLLPEPGSLAVSHHNLANYLLRAQHPPMEAVAHRLAAVLLYLLSGRSARFQDGLRALARDLRRFGDAALPADLAELISRVESVPGARFGAVLADLAPDPQRRATLVREVGEAVRALPADDSATAHLERWAPRIPVVVAAARGDRTAADALQPLLDDLGGSVDWAVLAATIRRIIDGERDEERLLDGLDEIDSAIVRAILAAVAAPPAEPAA